MSDIVLLCPECEHIAIEFSSRDQASGSLGDVILCPHCGQTLMVGCDMVEDSFWYELEIVENADNT